MREGLARALLLLFLISLAVLPERAAGEERTTEGAGEASAQDEAKAEERTPDSGKRRLTENEALLVARALLEQDRREEAADVYRQLLEHGRKREYRIEAAFQLAGMAMAQGRYREAISLYLRILNQNPNLARVRLELARAYFFNRDYDEAQLQFELVKGGGLPAPVQEKVEEFLTRIRRTKDWNASFGITLVPDSNISQASGGSEECIAFGGMLLCRPLEKKESGIGLSAGGTFNHYLHFTRDVGLRTTVGVDALEYERNDFDDYQLLLASGPRCTFESGEVSLQPMFRKRWYGGKQYSEEWGARVDGQKMLGRFILNGGASWVKTRYAQAYIDEFLRGKSWSASGRVRYILNDRTFAQAGVAFQRETTRVKTYGSDNWRYALGLYRIFPWGFSFFGELSLTTSRYHDEQWYITKDYRIATTVRKDRTWQAFASLASDLFEAYNITPMLQYAYVKRTSNIWSREYDRHRVNVSVSYQF